MHCCEEALLLNKVSGNRLPKGVDISLKPTKGICYNLQLQPIYCVGCNAMHCCEEALLLYKVSGNRLPKGG